MFDLVSVDVMMSFFPSTILACYKLHSTKLRLCLENFSGLSTAVIGQSNLALTSLKHETHPTVWKFPHFSSKTI